jgi:uncharacterized membrane protein
MSTTLLFGGQPLIIWIGTILLIAAIGLVIKLNDWLKDHKIERGK